MVSRFASLSLVVAAVMVFSPFTGTSLAADASVAKSASPASSGKATPGAKAVPTTVTAQRMQYDAERQIVVFEGDVHVNRPDFEMWSVKLTLYLGKAQGKKAGDKAAPAGMEAGEIERIVAEKDVRMLREGRHGECQKATYTTRDGLMIMEGSPVLFDKENEVKGETIYFYTRENRSEVRGGKTRPVEAVFTSSSSTPLPGSDADKEKE